MDLIKKIFPDYKSKAELKNRIAFLEGMNMSPIQTVERNVQKLCVKVEFGEYVPVDIIKRKLSRDMAEFLEPMMEYDIRDSKDIPYKYLVGTLYVVRR